LRESRVSCIPLHADLPAVVDGLELLAEFGDLLLQLRQALGLAGHFLQLPAGNPHGAARFGAYLAVVTLGADQLDLLARGQGADDAIAIGGTTANESIQTVTDPASVAVIVFLGMDRRCGQQRAKQAGADEMARSEAGKQGRKMKRYGHERFAILEEE